MIKEKLVEFNIYIYIYIYISIITLEALSFLSKMYQINRTLQKPVAGDKIPYKILLIKWRACFLRKYVREKNFLKNNINII